MKSQIRKRWLVIAVTACLASTLAIAIAVVSIDLARGSAGADQSFVSEKEQPADRMEEAKMPAVQSAVATVKVTEGNFDEQVLKSGIPVLLAPDGTLYPPGKPSSPRNSIRRSLVGLRGPSA